MKKIQGKNLNLNEIEGFMLNLIFNFYKGEKPAFQQNGGR